jgi:hypothetical protein
MPVKFSDLEMAFMFVSGAPMCSHSAYLDPESGRLFYISDLVDEEPPDDLDDNEKYIEIPHKNELDLGKRLVLDFIADRMPEELERIDTIFRKKGAYAKFKDFLENNSLLKEWYSFEEERQTEALKEWCEENGIIIERGVKIAHQKIFSVYIGKA